MEINIVPLCFGALFFIVGLVILIKQLMERKNSTYRVKAQVIRYEEKIHHDTETAARSIVYYPVVKYYVNGQWYEVQKNSGSGRRPYALGQEIEIMCNPNNPEQFYLPGDKTSFIVAIGGIILGGVVIYLAFFG